MKRALINPLENNRLCQVAAEDFPVADPLLWVDCTDDATPQTHYCPDGKTVVPIPPAVVDPAVLAEQQRVAQIDATIAAATFNGGVTIAQLKAMTRDQFNTWWAANVTNAAQAIGVLKFIAWQVLRKL